MPRGTSLTGGAGRAGRGAHVPETPKPQRKGACRRVGRERGWVEGGRYGAWVWLSKDRVPLAEAPQVGSRLGLRSEPSFQLLSCAHGDAEPGNFCLRTLAFSSLQYTHRCGLLGYSDNRGTALQQSVSFQVVLLTQVPKSRALLCWYLASV